MFVSGRERPFFRGGIMGWCKYYRTKVDPEQVPCLQGSYALMKECDDFPFGCDGCKECEMLKGKRCRDCPYFSG